MADFVAVLKKTIGGLSEDTPAMREKVYQKARATVAAKLAALNPPPPEAIAERQKRLLEDAIASVEAEYAAPEPAVFEDDLEAVFASLSAPPVIARPAAPPAPPPLEPAFDPAAEEEERYERVAPRPMHVERLAGMQTGRAKRRSGFAGITAAAAIVIALGGAGYAVWINKDEVTALLGMEPVITQAEAPPAPAPAEEEPAAEEPVAEETEIAAVTPPAAAQPEQPADAGPAGEVAAKFTQRLNADGTESDAGPAGGEPGIGEGTTLVAATTPPPPATANDAAAPPAGATPPAEAPAQVPAPDAAAPVAPTAAPAAATASSGETPAVTVGQRAIFYEERTSAAQGSASTGSIVWSVIEESPGGDLPPEPAIRAEATIPGKDIQLRMTIRRNGDATLPASHIVEMIFLTPDNFEGGVVDNVLRMTMKDTEQATGNPLIGFPAKIADGFFLVALSDGKPELATNLALLRRQKWIDIPIVYRSGRRALMTVEKGIPGDKVFDQVLKTWETALAAKS